jgi:G3E family GTPase
VAATLPRSVSDSDRRLTYISPPTGLFNFEKAHRNPLWFKGLNGFKGHAPETEEYGVRSFVYRARRPFHPAKFRTFCNESWPGVIRAKGFFWLAPRPAFAGEVAQAGAMIKTSKRCLWWFAVSTIAGRTTMVGERV